MVKYLRDGRAPIPKNEVTSKVMSAIRAKNTQPELILRKALSSRGIRHYRLHCQNVPGRPDICFRSRKIAIFVNGCYWHRCPYCKPSFPKSHKVFWRNKFLKNVARDKRKRQELKKDGWRVMIVWECQIKKNIDKVVTRVDKFLENR